eukprot:526163-Pyramimonas_sp.AAC.1
MLPPIPPLLPHPGHFKHPIPFPLPNKPRRKAQPDLQMPGAPTPSVLHSQVCFSVLILSRFVVRVLGLTTIRSTVGFARAVKPDLPKV